MRSRSKVETIEVGIMKMGAENRKKIIAAAALIVIVMVLMATRSSVLLGLGSSSSARPTTVAADIPPDWPIRGTASRDLRAGLKKDTAQSLDPTLRTDLIRASEDTKYEGTGRNIFKVFVKPPKVETLVVPPITPQPQQGHVPPLPPIELKYYGYATPQGGIKRIFLAHDEDVFITQEGEIVDRRYKVVRISPTAVEILDVLSNHRQSLPLIQG